tara:strand:+ start:289 stop:612 length:324 start_codon:yes stop_codon:yes gene_type:complete
MNKVEKTNFLVDGMIEQFTKKPQRKLCDQIIGLKFKQIRLKQGKTAEQVVDDNKQYFSQPQELYRFEKGINTDASKLFALCIYYKYTSDIEHFFDRLKSRRKNVHLS